MICGKLKVTKLFRPDEVNGLAVVNPPEVNI